MSTTLTAPKRIGSYFLPDNGKDPHLEYKEKKIADDLCKYLLEEYTQELMYGKSASVRMNAAEKIADYTTPKSESISILLDAVRMDENLNVRNQAKVSIEAILRKSDYRN